MDDDELEEVKCYAEWLWACPACGEVNNAGDIEPAGETECEMCSSVVTITGAM